MGLWDEPRVDRQRAPRIFLACAATDHRFAATLIGDLRQRGVAVESDPVGAESSVLLRLAQSAASPDWLIVVLSPAALRSSLIAQEMRIAADLLQGRRLRGVLAVAATPVSPAQLPRHSPITHSFDATRDYSAALRGLCAALGIVDGDAYASQPPMQAPVPPPPPRDLTREETALLPVAPDISREETALLPALANSRVARRRLDEAAYAAPNRAPVAANDGVRSRAASLPGSTVREQRGEPGGVARQKGITRRSLMGVGVAVAAAALAGGVFQVWRTAPSPLPALPTPSVRWRYLINSAAVTPTLEARGAVYFGAVDGHFYALDIASRSLRWAYDVQQAIRPDDPVVEADAVYCCTGDGDALKLSDDPGGATNARRLLWRFQFPHAAMLTPALSAGVLYISCQYARLFAVNSGNGEIIWVARPPFSPSSPPTLAGSRLYVAGLDSVVALTSSDGAEIWKTPVGGQVTAQIALSKGSLYACMKDNKVFALDAATGKQRWSFTTEGLLNTAPALDESHKTVFVGDANNYVYALDTGSGALRWRQQLDNGVFSLKYFKGSVHAVSRGGYLYAFDPVTGTMRWQYVVGEGVASPLGVGANTLYAGSADGYLYALDIPD